MTGRRRKIRRSWHRKFRRIALKAYPPLDSAKSATISDRRGSIEARAVAPPTSPHRRAVCIFIFFAFAFSAVAYSIQNNGRGKHLECDAAGVRIQFSRPNQTLGILFTERHHQCCE